MLLRRSRGLGVAFLVALCRAARPAQTSSRTVEASADFQPLWQSMAGLRAVRVAA